MNSEQESESDQIARFAQAEKETVRRLWQLAIVFGLFLAVGAVGMRYENPGDTFGFYYGGFGLLAILICLSRISAAYRCPVCNKRPFQVFASGMSSSAERQRDLTNEIHGGLCGSCGAKIKEPRPLVPPQRRKW